MFFLIDKPKNISSFQFIKNFARTNNFKKIGHTGTLDPIATGALLVATDDDTKLIDYIDKGYKTYNVTFILGYKSDTLDTTGNLVQTHTDNISLKEVANAAQSFQGYYLQTPPNYSAKKIGGQRAYKLARKNQPVKLKPVKVEIKNISDIKKIAKNTFNFNVVVSRGTYIRSLIFDLAKSINNSAVMSQLRRTHIGKLKLSQEVEKINIKKILNLQVFIIPKIEHILNGKNLLVNINDGEYALEFQSQIIGVVQVSQGVMKSKKLFGNKISLLLK